MKTYRIQFRDVLSGFYWVEYMGADNFPIELVTFGGAKTVAELIKNHLVCYEVCIVSSTGERTEI